MPFGEIGSSVAITIIVETKNTSPGETRSPSANAAATVIRFVKRCVPQESPNAPRSSRPLP